MKRCVIYTRVSTDLEAQVCSLDTQESICREFCKRNGWVVVQVLRDQDYSGDDLSRPGIKAIEQLALNREIDVALAKDNDRLGKAHDMPEWMAKVIAAGVELYTCAGKMRLETEEDMLQNRVIYASHQYQLDVQRRKTRIAKEERTKMGYWTSRCPFGAMPGQEKGVQIQDPDRYPYLLTIFEMAAAGYSDTQIRNHLNDLGVTTRPTKNSPGSPMTSSTIERIIANRYYIGELVYKDQGVVCKDAKHDVRVEKGTWLRAQRKRTGKPGRPAKDFTYLLKIDNGRHKVFCDHFQVTHPNTLAGKPVELRPRHTLKKGKPYRYYTRADKCSYGDRGVEVEVVEESGSLPVNIPAELLDKLVVEALIDHADDNKIDELMVNSVSAATEQLETLVIRLNQRKDQIAKKKEQLTKLEKKAVAAFSGDDDHFLKTIRTSLNEQHQELEQMQAEQAADDAELAALREYENELDHVRDQVNLIGALYDSGEHKKLAQLLDKLIEKVIVRADCIYVDLRPLPMFQQQDGVVSNGCKAAPTGIEPVPPP